MKICSLTFLRANGDVALHVGKCSPNPLYKYLLTITPEAVRGFRAKSFFSNVNTSVLMKNVLPSPTFLRSLLLQLAFIFMLAPGWLFANGGGDPGGGPERNAHSIGIPTLQEAFVAKSFNAVGMPAAAEGPLKETKAQATCPNLRIVGLEMPYCFNEDRNVSIEEEISSGVWAPLVLGNGETVVFTTQFPNRVVIVPTGGATAIVSFIATGTFNVTATITLDRCSNTPVTTTISGTIGALPTTPVIVRPAGQPLVICPDVKYGTTTAPFTLQNNGSGVTREWSVEFNDGQGGDGDVNQNTLGTQAFDFIVTQRPSDGEAILKVTFTANIGGCKSSTVDVYEVLEGPGPIAATVAAGANPNVCAGGTLGLEATPVTGATYSWAFAAGGQPLGVSLTNGNTRTPTLNVEPDVDDATQITLIVTVTDDEGCPKQSNPLLITVRNLSGLTPELALVDDKNALCLGDDLEFTVSGLTAGSGSYIIEYQIGEGNAEVEEGYTPDENITVEDLGVGIYPLKLLKVLDASVTAECGLVADNDPLDEDDFAVNQISAGSLGTPAPICPNETPVSISSDEDGESQLAGDDIEYQWQFTIVANPAENDWTVIGNVISKDLSFGYLDPLTVTTQYRRLTIVTNGDFTWSACAATAPVTVTVFDGFEGGELSTPLPVCEGGEATIVSIEEAAYNGDNTDVEDITVVYSWQSTIASNPTEVDWSTIVDESSSTLTVDALAVTTKFRRLAEITLKDVDNELLGVCTAISNVVTVEVNILDGGVINGDQLICSGTAPATIESDEPASGNLEAPEDETVTVDYEWEYTTDEPNGDATWITIDGANGADLEFADDYTLSVTTHFRRKATVTTPVDGGNDLECGPVYSNVVTVTVNVVSGGSIAEDQIICLNDAPDDITSTVGATASLDGVADVVYTWESIVAGPFTWQTLYTEASSKGVDDPSYVPYIGPDLDFSTLNGLFIDDVGTPFTLSRTRAFRRVATITSNIDDAPLECTAYSNEVIITVNEVDGGEIASDQTICSGTKPNNIIEETPATSTLPPFETQDLVNGTAERTSTGVDPAYAWESATGDLDDNTDWSEIDNADGADLEFADDNTLSVTTHFRRKATFTTPTSDEPADDLVCTVYSNVVTITVNEVEGGTITGAQTICPGTTPAEITGEEVEGSLDDSGTAYAWESATGVLHDNTDWSEIADADGADLEFAADYTLSETTHFRRKATVTSGDLVCTVYSNSVTVSTACVGVRGTITYYRGTDVAADGVTVSLKDGAAIDDDGITNASGVYIVQAGTLNTGDDPAPSVTNAVIEPSKDNNLIGGDLANYIDADDVLAIRRHLGGGTRLTTAGQLIAANVVIGDSDNEFHNKLNNTDATVLAQAVNGNESALARIVWRFFPSLPAITVPTTGPRSFGLVPLASAPGDPAGYGTHATTIGIASLDDFSESNNFKAVLVGDVVPKSTDVFVGSDEFYRSSGRALVWSLEDRQLEEGETIEVAFRADQMTDIAAWQFGLRFDPSQLEAVDIVTAPSMDLDTDEHFGLYRASRGEIRSLWAGEFNTTLPKGTDVFSVRFNVHRGGSMLSTAIAIDDKVLRGFAVGEDDKHVPVLLAFREAGQNHTVAAQPVLYQNAPNPFNQDTRIRFELPVASDIQLVIHDMNGRMIKEVNGFFSEGLHEVRLGKAEFKGVSGVLMYTLRSGDFVATRRMVVIE
jgi:hypothetical protein